MGRIHIERVRSQADTPRARVKKDIPKVGHLGDLVVKNTTERARREAYAGLGAYWLRSNGASSTNRLNDPSLPYNLIIRSGTETAATRYWQTCQVVCQQGSVWTTPNQQYDQNTLSGASNTYRVVAGDCINGLNYDNWRIGELSDSAFRQLCRDYANTHPAPPPTFESPTTQPPTTEATTVTTEAPTTITTEPPTTQPPTTVTTEAPTTQAPTTEATTQATTLPPTTEATTQATTLPPTTVTTEAPTTVTTQAPTTVTTEATTQAPTTEVTTEAPTEPPTVPKPSSSYAPSSTVAQSLAYFSSEIPTDVYQNIVSTTQAYISSHTSSPVVSSTTGFASTSAHHGPAPTALPNLITGGTAGVTVVSGGAGGGVDGAAIGFSFLGVGAAVAILVSGIVGTTKIIKAYLSYREAHELKANELPVRYTNIPNS